MTEPTSLQEPSATQTLLLIAAEKLFAREGIDAVSTRRIAQEAGQRNISATYYHFGGKEQLIDALLALRMREINRRREALLDTLAQKPAPRLHDWLETLVRPLIDELPLADSHFVGCLHQLYSRARGERVYANLEPALVTGIGRAVNGITPLLAHLPSEVVGARMLLFASQMIHSAADWYYQRERGEALAPVDAMVATLVDFIAGGLLAPVSSDISVQQLTPARPRRKVKPTELAVSGEGKTGGKK